MKATAPGELGQGGQLTARELASLLEPADAERFVILSAAKDLLAVSGGQRRGAGPAQSTSLFGPHARFFAALRMTAAGAQRTFPVVYTTCLFCQADLGRNAVIEAFPVGRRLAYDQDKGRLWVVCRMCERWNLTPQEERWEAMEQAERLYRGTRLRASTDNVGLARLRDRTELVRIGRPLRPEFAAWRYGDQFGRRRTRQMLMVGGAVAVASVVVVAGPVMGLFSLSGLGNLPNLLNMANHARRTRTRIAVTDGADKNTRSVSLVGAGRARLVPDETDGFALLVNTYAGTRFESWMRKPDEMRLTGPAAVLAASRLLPHVNRGGGSAVNVRGAVDMLDAAGGSDALFATLARDAWRHRSNWTYLREWKNPNGALGGLTPRARLALEMAAHEEQERRALEGELRELEQAWAQAEEIAAIADDLLLPEGVGAKLGQLKARSSARTGAPSSPTTDSGAASNS